MIWRYNEPRPSSPALSLARTAQCICNSQPDLYYKRVYQYSIYIIILTVRPHIASYYIILFKLLFNVMVVTLNTYILYTYMFLKIFLRKRIEWSKFIWQNHIIKCVSINYILYLKTKKRKNRKKLYILFFKLTLQNSFLVWKLKFLQICKTRNNITLQIFVSHRTMRCWISNNYVKFCGCFPCSLCNLYH